MSLGLILPRQAQNGMMCPESTGLEDCLHVMLLHTLVVLMLYRVSFQDHSVTQFATFELHKTHTEKLNETETLFKASECKKFLTLAVLL